jgi:hypothetical protein
MKTKIEIQKGEATLTRPCATIITMADLREAFKMPADTEMIFVGTNQIVMKDESIACSWTETVVQKPRKKREKGAAE